MEARRRTGRIEVETAKVSGRPGVCCSLPIDSSTTMVHRAGLGSAGRARSSSGSTRTRRGPSALGATNSAAGPSMRDLGRSETRPAQASGAASAS